MRRILFALAFAASSADAQGTLGGQGFGYPAGQLGARAAATAGALAAFDAVTPVNPATIANWQRTVLFFHLEPEYRSTNVENVSTSTRLSRFPLAGAATKVGARGALAVSVSTYLDRTWETAASGVDTVGGDEFSLTTRYGSTGAINDVRAGFGWSFGALQVGAAMHAYTGENRLKITWDFPDSSALGDVAETSVLGYSGQALSAGVQWRIGKEAALAAYARRGGTARLRVGDTLVSKGTMPDHLGFAARYDGITGSEIAIAWEKIDWTAMRGLGSGDLGISDASRFSIGIETRGPLVGRTPMFIRAGGARRTLPFAALGTEVKETLFSLGAGFTIAQGRGNLDFALQRALRSAGDGRERAWLLTFGLAISP